MIAELASLGPKSSSSGLAWSSSRVGPVDYNVYPKSYIIHSNSGYKRARDFSSDAKYDTEEFGDFNDVQQGSKGHKF